MMGGQCWFMSWWLFSWKVLVNHIGWEWFWGSDREVTGDKWILIESISRMADEEVHDEQHENQPWQWWIWPLTLDNRFYLHVKDGGFNQIWIFNWLCSKSDKPTFLYYPLQGSHPFVQHIFDGIQLSGYVQHQQAIHSGWFQSSGSNDECKNHVLSVADADDEKNHDMCSRRNAYIYIYILCRCATVFLQISVVALLWNTAQMVAMLWKSVPKSVAADHSEWCEWCELLADWLIWLRFIMFIIH